MKHVLTPEQLALSAERKRRKAEAAQSALVAPSQLVQAHSTVLSRSWLTLSDASPSSGHRPSEQTTIMSWNMLAQCLVRRELFPTSDCLKAGQREGMLIEEITKSNADIICLQEVDRLEKFGPALQSADYAFTYSSGPRKKHGCIIAYREDVYEKVAEQTIFYDDVEVRSDGPSERARRGSSFRTRNIGLIVSLKRRGSEGEHVVVATTHLFWHPKYTYERARQALILTRSTHDFKEKNNLRSSITFIAGDFNFNPSDAAYSLLVGDDLTPEQEFDIMASHVVHASIDPSLPIADPKQVANEEEGGDAKEEEDPDRVIKNARRAGADDGLLESGELAEEFRQLPPLRSAYDEWSFEETRMFGSRVDLPYGRRGRSEPMYTSYTHYWKVTLDYIFVVLPPGRTLKVLGVLEPPVEEELGAGLPRKGVCGSDHLPLRAQIAWSPRTLEVVT
ncbi:hypothetical protein M0805_004245 [Coniferiporia weirii]|nr:hypothetical protein M0805_004245 [Coniferiporia weirii]